MPWVSRNGHTGGVQIPVDRALLEAYRRRWHITRLSFFGSVLREDFKPDSDVDVLVEFADGKHPGIKLVAAKDELETLLGRPVDLVTRKAIEHDPNWLRRREILETAQVIVGD